MANGELIIEPRTLESGHPVIAWRGRRALYAAYDPKQISEARAIAALVLFVPDALDILRVTRVGDGRESSQSRIVQSMATPLVQERAG